MEVIATVWNDWNVLAIEGEFVVKHLVKVRQHLQEVNKQKIPKVAFDLTKTTYIDSSAITLMLNYHKRLKTRNGNVIVCGASQDTKSIFSIVGLDSSISVFDTRGQFEEAVTM